MKCDKCKKEIKEEDICHYVEDEETLDSLPVCKACCEIPVCENCGDKMKCPHCGWGHDY